MAKCRKKPVVIDAYLITGKEWTLVTERDPHSVWFVPAAWPDWLQEAFSKPMEQSGALFVHVHGGYVDLKINTLEGDLLITLGDWVIRGVKGELYPCKLDIFEATYEAVDDD